MPGAQHSNIKNMHKSHSTSSKMENICSAIVHAHCVNVVSLNDAHSTFSAEPTVYDARSGENMSRLYATYSNGATKCVHEIKIVCTES